jgi:hypothetical protein
MRAAQRPEEEPGNVDRLVTMRAAQRPEEEPGNVDRLGDDAGS